MGFLSFLAFCICGGAMLVEDNRRTMETKRSREDAIKENRCFYYDAKGARRSTSNNERIIYKTINGSDCGVGEKTGTIYWDTIKCKEQNELNSKNKTIEGRDVNFYYKAFPQWKKKDGTAWIFPVNKANGKPYVIQSHVINGRLNDYIEYVTDVFSVPYTDYKNKVFIPREELSKWR